MTATDLIGGVPSKWLVTGWFTPDYRPLASRFAASLERRGAPYHLWAKPSLGEWNTTRKPQVVLETMNAYPGRTVVLMDVDCVINGSIEPVTRIEGDVGIVAMARDVTRRKRVVHWLAVECSSRVVVFRPTDPARAFAAKWAQTVAASPYKHDEHSMAWAWLQSPGLHVDYIDEAYSAREVGEVPDAIIEHDSAHDAQRRARRGRIKMAMRELEKRFLRSGRRRMGRVMLRA